MKKSLLLLATALLLPFGSAWATTTKYYAALKTTVSTKSAGMGKVYAGTSATAPAASKSDWKTDTSTSSSQSGSSSGTKYTFYAHALANENYEFDYWSSTDGGTSVSTANPYTVTVAATSSSSSAPSTTTVYANFKKKQLAGFSVTFATPSNGSYTIDGASGYGAKGPFTEVYSPTLAATANSGYAFNGWYTTTDGTTKGTLLSSASPWTGSFSAATTVMADFVESKTVKTYDELATALANNVCIEIPSGTTIIIESGKSLSLASGKTLIINGMLYVIGTFTNSGTVKGGGSLAKITKTITQTGNSNGSPITTDCADATKNKTYYKSAVASSGGTFTNNGTMSATEKAGAIVMRGGSRIAICNWPKSDTPVALCCTINSATAVNHITGFDTTSYYTSFADALKAVKGNTTTKMLLLLSNQSANQTTCVNAGLTYTSGKYTKLQANLGVMDLLGYQLTVSPSYIDTYTHILLNGKLSVSTLMYSGTVTCLNCSTVSFSTMKEDYSSVVNIYDCTCSAQIVSGYNGSLAMNSRINFYSSGAGSSYSSSKFNSTKTAYRIFGGRWDENPGETYIGDTLKQTHKFYQNESDSKWYLEPSADKKVVTLDDGTTYESLADAFTAIKAAFDAGTKTSVTMTMAKNATLATPFTVPSGKTLEIELAGFKITASTGLIVNNGTFIIGDKDGTLAATGGSVETTSGDFIVNNGEVHITYGYYTGNMVLNGGTFTTHHGSFTGTFSGNAAYANLKGGYFTQDISAFLKAGYYRRNGYVGPLPIPVITKSYVSENGGYWKYNLKLLSDKDSKIYCTEAVSRSGYSVDDWRRRGEIQSMVTPYFGYTIDTAIRFDRAITKGSATANITKPSVGANALNKDVAAGGLYRILSEQLAHPTSPLLSPSTQIGYQAALKDSTYKEMEFGVYSSTDANKGTTMDMRFDLCTGSFGTDISNLQSVYALMGERTVIGAQATSTTKKQAMIQPTTGAATFYDTIAAAVSACAKDGTVKLCNDIDSTADIVIAKACKIDTNGMNVKGAIKAGDGYAMTVTDTTLSIESGLGKNCKIYTFAPITYNITYTLNGGENDPANPSSYTVESETITLKDPTKEHYVFTGWTPAGTIAKGSTGDKTFTAGWELALVTITIPNVANTTNTIVVSEGEAIRVEGNLYQVRPGVTVTVTYTAVGAFVPKTSVAKLENAKAGDTVDTSAIVIKPAVAKIDTTYYGTLPEALTAAKDDDTVVVLKGLVLDDPIAITTDTPAYTLDLNGHSVTGAIDLAENCTIDITNAYRGTIFDVMTAVEPQGATMVPVTTGVVDPICFESLDDAYWATTNDAGQVALAAVSNPTVKDIYGDDVVYVISDDFKETYQPTGEEIMRPEQPMENGMSAWQNDLLGRDPTDKNSGFYIDAPQNDKQDKVTISLQNADDVDGYWIQKPDGTEETQQDVKDFDISITGDDDPTGIYKVGAIVGNDDNTFVLTAPKTIVGLIKQVQNMEKAIIAVPWGSLEQGKNEIAVSNVVKTANLTAGDQLWVYRPGVTKENEHETWTLQEEGGRKYWYPGNNVFGDNDVVKSGDPQSATIPKGSGIWLIRTSNLDKPYYLYGQATDEPSAVPLVKGANLVGATGADEYDINAHITGAQSGDQIQVPGADGKKTLMTFKGGEWTREEAVAVTFRGKTTYKNVTTNDCKAAAGTGFWLFNQGGNIQVK